MDTIRLKEVPDYVRECQLYRGSSIEHAASLGLGVQRGMVELRCRNYRRCSEVTGIGSLTPREHTFWKALQRWLDETSQQGKE